MRPARLFLSLLVAASAPPAVRAESFQFQADVNKLMVSSSEQERVECRANPAAVSVIFSILAGTYILDVYRLQALVIQSTGASPVPSPRGGAAKGGGGMR